MFSPSLEKTNLYDAIIKAERSKKAEPGRFRFFCHRHQVCRVFAFPFRPSLRILPLSLRSGMERTPPFSPLCSRPPKRDFCLTVPKGFPVLILSQISHRQKILITPRK
jgi:hypothetical protein